MDPRCTPTSEAAIDPPGPGPALPYVATPIAVGVTFGPEVTISWNRIPGDDGTNTDYRLYVGDLSRDGPALDVITKDNFYGAYLVAEGRRYDAIVFATRNGVTVQGPASGFMVSGFSASAPVVAAPTHNSTLRQGPFRLAWSPVPGAKFYDYYVAQQSQSQPILRGMTSELYVDTFVPVTGSTRLLAIVRACLNAPCTLDSDEGWGPWSNTVTGTTTFTITP